MNNPMVKIFLYVQYTIVLYKKTFSIFKLLQIRLASYKEKWKKSIWVIISLMQHSNLFVNHFKKLTKLASGQLLVIFASKFIFIYI